MPGKAEGALPTALRTLALSSGCYSVAWRSRAQGWQQGGECGPSDLASSRKAPLCLLGCPGLSPGAQALGASLSLRPGLSG